MHLTNPKAILGWTAIMSLGLKPDTPMVVVLAMLAGCFVISVSVNCGYAALFSTSSMINGYRRARRSVQSTLAVLFAAAGLKLLLSR
jgi:threonine/homoserine/homoserine lactone efflux protein